MAADCEPRPEAATSIFGARLPLSEQYADLLSTDGVVRGLIGPSEPERLWSRHLLNCAVLGEVIGDGLSVIDIGSGAGLPGIPLAIARPDLHITLVEPLLRRTTFLEEVVDRLGLDNVTVVRGRAEEKTVRDEVGVADVVTSRAVAPLDRLAGWSGPLIRVGGQLIALKGRSVHDEIVEHDKAAKRFGLVNLRVENCGGEILDEPTTLLIGDRVETPEDVAAARRAARRAKRKS
ncbi:MAG: 16S rRNA (guanine(527)-N(7))-methyltransferase RsmG [Gordonia sp. (in: high G+C Gram-positive bacteria)]